MYRGLALIILFLSTGNLFSQGKTIDYFAQAKAKYNQKKFDKCIELTNLGLSKDSMNAAYYSLRGMAKFSLKQDSAAIKDINKSLDIDPTQVELYYQRGLSKYFLKQYQNAITDFNIAINLRPRDLIQVATIVRNLPSTALA